MLLLPSFPFPSWVSLVTLRVKSLSVTQSLSDSRSLRPRPAEDRRGALFAKYECRFESLVNCSLASDFPRILPLVLCSPLPFNGVLGALSGNGTCPGVRFGFLKRFGVLELWAVVMVAFRTEVSVVMVVPFVILREMLIGL